MITKAIDMHCDTISVLLEEKRKNAEKNSVKESILRENNLHLDLKRMKNCGYLLQNFALFVDDYRCQDSWEEACALYEVYREQIKANEDIIRPVYSYKDIEENVEAGFLSSMLTVKAV